MRGYKIIDDWNFEGVKYAVGEKVKCDTNRIYFGTTPLDSLQYKSCNYSYKFIEIEVREWTVVDHKYSTMEVEVIAEIPYDAFEKLCAGVLSRYHDGSLVSTTTYEYGRRSGDCITFHPNGQKHEEMCYYRGKRTSCYFRWSNTGELLQEDLYHMGENSQFYKDLSDELYDDNE